jgi:hypothetical protein
MVEAPRFDFGSPTPERLEHLLRLQNAYARACSLLRRRNYEGAPSWVFWMHARRCSRLHWLLIRGRREAGMPSRRIRPTAFSPIGHFHSQSSAARAYLASEQSGDLFTPSRSKAMTRAEALAEAQR